ncbi:hypothetical protein RI845_02085 [Thalassotalea nanhaiensis]|uniref:Lipoprotein n=1 Tax=Thalassotalea nanhaiensis TaxID=3065648 RepID=A0ABY9TJU0_9GAMM|nr:hypothetical protein RI845_02085 [Colwelliaceae bacterium SQ345]
MKLLPMMLIIISTLTGCVGLSYTSFKANTSTIQAPIVSSNKGYLLESGKSLNPSELIKKWGEPNTKVVKGMSEEWTYHFKELDKGFFALFVVIPIPVFLDDGFEKITFLIEGDEITKAEARYQYESGVGCMAVFLVHGLVNSVCNGDRLFLKNDIPLVFINE